MFLFCLLSYVDVVLLVLCEQAEEEDKDGDDETSGFVDVTAPHPEFVLSPPNTRVSSREFEDICEDLAPPSGKGELKNSQHPFLRALRRGVYRVARTAPVYGSSGSRCTRKWSRVRRCLGEGDV